MRHRPEVRHRPAGPLQWRRVLPLLLLLVLVRGTLLPVGPAAAVGQALRWRPRLRLLVRAHAHAHARSPSPRPAPSRARGGHTDVLRVATCIHLGFAAGTLPSVAGLGAAHRLTHLQPASGCCGCYSRTNSNVLRGCNGGGVQASSVSRAAAGAAAGLDVRRALVAMLLRCLAARCSGSRSILQRRTGRGEGGSRISTHDALKASTLLIKCALAAGWCGAQPSHTLGKACPPPASYLRHHPHTCAWCKCASHARVRARNWLHNSLHMAHGAMWRLLTRVVVGSTRQSATASSPRSTPASLIWSRRA